LCKAGRVARLINYKLDSDNMSIADLMDMPARFMDKIRDLFYPVNQDEFNDAKLGAMVAFQPYAEKFLEIAQTHMNDGYGQYDAGVKAYLEIKDRLYNAMYMGPGNGQAYRDLCNAREALLIGDFYNIAGNVRMYRAMQEAQKAQKASEKASP